MAFAAAVYVVQGSAPSLGPDHLGNLGLADSIRASHPDGDYWRETNSVRFFGVLLAYLEAWTGSHVLSMKIVLAVSTVLYLLAAELFFRCFTEARWQAVLFALLSAFSVSFGFTSWGLTDSTALRPHTLVAPLVMLSMWFWFRFDGRPVMYLAFSVLALGSLMYVSTFYALGVLVLVEAWDFVALRKMRIDRLFPALLGGLLLAGTLLAALEYVGVSITNAGSLVPGLLRSVGVDIPQVNPGTFPLLRMAPTAAAPVIPIMTASEAWAVELSLRPWRNMPLPLVNVANALASSALILFLAVAGIVAARHRGFTRADRLMLAMFFAVPIFAFGPQTVLWILRSFAPVHPVAYEEVMALSLIMIPALYFVLGLFRRILESKRPRAQLEAGAVVVAVLALPLVMKNLPHWAREGILSTVTAWHIVDTGNASRVASVRSALGLSASAPPTYYATQGVREWLARNTAPGARILTDRDDMILLRDRVILGPRVLDAYIFTATALRAGLFQRTSRAMQARDTDRVREIAESCDADFAVVAWRVDGAAYSDDAFSVIAVRQGAVPSRP